MGTPSDLGAMREGTVAALAAALRQFWRIAGAYWQSAQRRRAWTVTAALVLATLANALLQLRLNLWLGSFFNSIEAHALAEIRRDIFIFLALAAGLMVTAASLIYLKASLQIGWRSWIASNLIDRWLERGHSFLLRFGSVAYDNPDHRIGEDVRMVTEAAVDFSAGLINSTLLLVIFMGTLWVLSGTITVSFGETTAALPGYLVVAAIAYAAASTGLAHLMGHPLVKRSERRHAREGDFRFTLVRVRENAEGVALAHGEAVERATLRDVFGRLVEAFLAEMRMVSRLTLATTGFTVMSPVIPLLIAAPQYLAGSIGLGELMQISQAFVQVQVALGFFVDNYARLSDWLAGINRIVRLDAACRALDATPPGGRTHIDRHRGTNGVLRLKNLRVATPAGDLVIDRADAVVHPGEKVLVTGDVGIGKTTLFRALAGLWPWGGGVVEVPDESSIMFMPHRPYLPSGTLRTAIAYPHASSEFDDAAIRAAMTRCGFDGLTEKLDVDARWDQILSDAEQQRLSFVRLLLQRPAWAIMDEALSELDDTMVAILMSTFRNELQGTALLSIATRNVLPGFHDRVLVLSRLHGSTRLEQPQPEPAAAN
ncbi:MAG: ABC transporter ATP-binding protein/permease [Alphaproteobacteria bacterium]|nr:ABC transporter ATP-binding protein/permease [Alphaproteobacteria bacterium]